MLEKLFPKFFGEGDFNRDLLEKINQIIKQSDNLKVLEAGGADRPLLEKSDKWTYYGMDIDQKPSCYKCYDKFLVQSIEEKIDDDFDLIISQTLLEHVPNNTKSIEAMYNALNNGGAMLHYLPSKAHIYSICLRLVGPKIQKALIKHLRPEAVSTAGYPAFFDKCSTHEMRELC